MPHKSTAPVRLAALLAVSMLPLAPLSFAAADDVPAAPPATEPANDAPPAPIPVGHLKFTVIIVDDLTPKPVPLQDFKIQALDDAGAPTGEPKTLRTGLDGVIQTDLPPGRYSLQNPNPLRFKGRVLEWKREFAITADNTTDLQLTGEDAATHVEAIPASRQVADEAKIYRAVVDSVATVEGEAGHGTGFLVDRRGLLLTNQHVVEGSRRFVVRFRPGLRVAAQLVEADPNADIAIVRVNPATVQNLPVLTLANAKPDEPLAVEGEKVMAIGSPISEEKVLTTGLVSRVKDGVIISDVNINPGNSGGPLLNLAGEVIGLTTFAEQVNTGPGLSGIITIDRAKAALQRAQAKLDADVNNASAPSEKLLPDFSPVKIPTSLLTDAGSREIKPIDLKGASAFQTRIYTPFVLASLDGAKERELAKKKDKRAKKQSAQGLGEGGQLPTVHAYTDTEAEVQIVMAPKLVESKASKRRGFLGAMLGGLTGSFVQTKKSYEYRHDFYDMELWRDGVKVEPLRRNRVPLSIYFDNGWADAKDTAMAGVYSFPPEAFKPGGKLELKVTREFNTEKWETFKISEAQGTTLYNQFSGYWKYAETAEAQPH